MASKIQLRRDSSGNWSATNPVLAEGEMGVELDTNRSKLGDGTSNWNDIDYMTDTNAVGTYDANYLIKNRNVGDQTVVSTGTTTFSGLLQTRNVQVRGNDEWESTHLQLRSTSTIGRIGFDDDNAIRINKDGAFTFNCAASSISGYGYTNVNIVSSHDDNSGQTFASGIRLNPDINADFNDFVGYDFRPNTTSFAGSTIGTAAGFRCASNISQLTVTDAIGFYSNISATGAATNNFNFFANDNAPNFFAGNTYIGGTPTRNTRELWESTLTEEQKEQLSAGTLAIPANVSTPGDGSFVRQWWYNQQSAEDQALIDAGELDYPNRYQPANFVDTFDLGDATSINLMASGQSTIKNGLDIGRSLSAAASVYGGIRLNAAGPITTFVNADTVSHIFRCQSAANSSATKTDIPFEIKSNGDTHIGGDNIVLSDSGLGTFSGGVKVTGGSIANIQSGLAFGGNGNLYITNAGEQSIVIGSDGRKLAIAGTVSDTVGFYYRGDVGGDGDTNTHYAYAVNANVADGFAGNVYAYSAQLASSSQAEARKIQEKVGYNVPNAFAAQEYAAQENYAFRGELGTAPNGTENYNFYAAGTAPNYFAGNALVSTVPNATLTGSATPDSGCRLDNYGAAIISRVNNDQSAPCLVLNRTSTNTEAHFAHFYLNNAKIGEIQADGSGGVQIQNTSDYRLKENIVDLPSATAAIKSLRPVNFNFKSHPGKTRPGFIAHEVQDAFPAAVTGTKDATEAIGTLADYDGTVLETGVTEPSADELTYTEDVTDSEGVTTQIIRTRTWTATSTRPVYQGVDQTKLIPLLTKALQEALDRIEQLESGSGGGGSELETRLSTLEADMARIKAI